MKPALEVLVFGALFALLVLTTYLAGRKRGRRRIAEQIRALTVEMDEERICCKTSFGQRAVGRSRVVEACLTPRGIWLRGASTRGWLAIPSELEGFDRLTAMVEEWIPESAVRRATPPGGFRENALAYGAWVVAGILSAIVMTGERPGIVAPASLVLGVWVAWYFAWCGR